MTSPVFNRSKYYSAVAFELGV